MLAMADDLPGLGSAGAAFRAWVTEDGLTRVSKAFPMNSHALHVGPRGRAPQASLEACTLC